jgi:BMFP domain-containing protein YqiC
MTKLSKALVIANLLFSMAVAACAAGFFFSRIDWSDKPATADSEPGQLVARVARLKEMLAAARPAETGWREARALVRERESFRAADRKLYQDEIAYIYNAPANGQLREVVLDANTGQPLLAADPTNKAHFLPTLRNVNDRFGKPLRSLDYYEKLHADNLIAMKKGNDQLTTLVNEDADLTVELAGGTTIGDMVVEKGLRKRIEDERVKGQDVLAEYDVVKRLLIKTVGDSEFLLARRRQLEKRVKELQDAPKVTKVP